MKQDEVLNIINRINQYEYERKNSVESRAGNFPYISPTPGEIPIVAVSPWPEVNSPTDKDFEGVSECGFNAALITSYDSKFVELAFKYASEHGIACILEQYGNWSQEKMEEFVLSLMSNENLKAYQLKDEPNFKSLDIYDGTPKQDGEPFIKGEVREMYNWIKETDPSRMVYMNLAYFANVVMEDGETKPYSSFLQYIQDNFTPALWSYDYYPIIANVNFHALNPINNTYGKPYVRSLFYPSLSEFANISQKTNRPFWAYCLSTQHTIDNYNGEYPAPTEGHLRFEAFSALAYGAQGVVYWYYAQRPNPIKNGQVVSVHSIAPVDRFGNKTEIWYNVQAVNKEIRRYQDVFLGCKPVSRFFRDASKEGDEGMKALRLVGPVDEVIASGKGVLVSYLTNNGYNYLVIVSKDPFEGQEITVKYSENYLSRYIVLEMTPNFIFSGSIMPDGSSALERKVKLVAGGYAILRWTTK